MERRKLSAVEIENGLSELDKWTLADKKISKKFEFKNFAESLLFVNKVGEIAEEFDHHPDICFGWGYADIYLTTHDAGGITIRDIAVAKEIDVLK